MIVGAQPPPSPKHAGPSGACKLGADQHPLGRHAEIGRTADADTDDIAQRQRDDCTADHAARVCAREDTSPPSTSPMSVVVPPMSMLSRRGWP